MYHLSVKPISRSAGRSATAAAAYRSGSLIIDERTGEVHDYTRKSDIVHSEILMPPGAPAWAGDRMALWNAAEVAEKRKDARVARDYEVAIPKELTKAQGIELVRDFSAALVDRYGVAVDFNVHRDDMRKWDGSEKGWQGYHAHILTTTRKLGRDGFGEKAEPELSDTKRKSLGLGDGAAEIERVRQLWEVTANRHLERADSSQRIDSRSLKDQGIDRDPTIHLGPHVTSLERDGIPSRLGDINRQVTADYEVRVEDRRIVNEMAAEIAEIYGRVVEGQNLPQRRSATALKPEEREAFRRGFATLVHDRDERVRRVLAQAQVREERRDKAHRGVQEKPPAAPPGVLSTLQEEGHRQALLAWEVTKEAAAKLVDQAKRLAVRLLEAAQPERLAAWARSRLQSERLGIRTDDVGPTTEATPLSAPPAVKGRTAAEALADFRARRARDKADQGIPSVADRATRLQAAAAEASRVSDLLPGHKPQVRGKPDPGQERTQGRTEDRTQEPEHPPPTPQKGISR